MIQETLQWAAGPGDHCGNLQPHYASDVNQSTPYFQWLPHWPQPCASEADPSPLGPQVEDSLLKEFHAEPEPMDIDSDLPSPGLSPWSHNSTKATFTQEPEPESSRAVDARKPRACRTRTNSSRGINKRRSLHLADVVPTSPPWSAIMRSLLSQTPKILDQSSWTSVHNCWRDVLQRSAMTGDVSQVQEVFRFVDGIIDSSSMHWLTRCAYLHLTRMLVFLTNVIKTDRENGRLRLEIGRGDATVALEIYHQSQCGVSAQQTLKQAKRRLRIARRWADLTGGSLLLVFTYHDKADIVMYLLFKYTTT
ncbi:hypothetical protein BDP55DRAFT_627253 [Colletotrichum godetiae]|uniref:Uncharacterized protein n=1 Tax=Colletotrichum godetiae TaxID=1209918 RepID=A0AAJ0F3K3_9PEZI|nr:uncharacterized protein BDP55DRAFT_627253 [Colletotrichum godetiae]KAK1691618.1 hypothetical protein BDP55DRAFT_627253 [Colletotrichum godetiae]